MQETPAQLTKDQLYGTWSLIACEGHSDAGEIMHPYGVEPRGMLFYDQHGNMMVVLMRQGRPTFASGDPLGGTLEELRSAYEGFDAYCGTYRLDQAGSTVTHELMASKFPNWVGTQQVRHVTLERDELRLTTPPIRARGAAWTLQLIWRRAT